SAKATARFLSCTGSSESTMSSLSGPRISFKAAWSNAAAACTNASAASLAVANCFWLDAGAAAASFSAAADKAGANETHTDTAKAARRIFDELFIFTLLFIILFLLPPAAAATTSTATTTTSTATATTSTAAVRTTATAAAIASAAAAVPAATHAG